MTRFSEISPLWQNFKRRWQLIDGLFSIGEIFYDFGQFSLLLTAQYRKHNLIIWSHWTLTTGVPILLKSKKLTKIVVVVWSGLLGFGGGRASTKGRGRLVEDEWLKKVTIYFSHYCVQWMTKLYPWEKHSYVHRLLVSNVPTYPPIVLNDYSSNIPILSVCL